LSGILKALIKVEDLSVNDTAATTSSGMPEAGQIEGLRLLAEPILAWYEQNARVLPWREQPDPYWVWISEIMLQQTRIEAALPYFYRFMEALPDIPALAKAEEATLLKLWEGLGYYNRVRNLQKAARIRLERHGGRLPSSYQHLLKLPGIGEYTAGAIASIAYHIPVPAVDGNALRVLARLLACRADIAQPQARKTLRTAAQAILPHERAGDFNQAMMDLGSLVCLPGAAPRCDLCPVTAGCAGYRQGVADKLPVKSPQKPRAMQQKTVLVLASQGKTLLRRRPEEGLLAGLWEFPNLDGWLAEEEVTSLLDGWGICPASVQRLADTRHIFTHIEWHMHGYLVYAADALPVQKCVWVDGETVRQEYALPSAYSAFTRYLPRWLKQSEDGALAE
jgi:A/G-specific adenine glycosylase